MRAAILCPGPSLNSTWTGRDGFDLVIAVNHAAEVGDADWVVSYDSSSHPGVKRALQKWGHLARVGVMSHEGNRTHGGWGDLRFVSNRECVPREVLRDGLGFSMCGALCLAPWLGATEVVIFGDDKAGGKYHDGTDCLSGTAARWEREGGMAQRIIDHYRERGIVFLRAVQAESEVA